MNGFGDKVRELRLERGLTQEDLAQRSELRLSSIQSIESGATWPRVDNAAKIASALGVTVDDLLRDAMLPERRTRANFVQAAAPKKQRRASGQNRPLAEPAPDLLERTREKVPA